MKTSQHNVVRSTVLSITALVALATMTACGSSDSTSDATPSASTASSTTTASTAAPPTASGSATSGSAAPSPAADTAALCSTFGAIPQELNSKDDNAVAAAAQDFGNALTAAPVPSGMPADAQDGLKAYASVLQNIKASDVPALESSTDPTKLYGDKVAAVQAFITYVSTTCASELSQTPTATAAPTPAPSS